MKLHRTMLAFIYDFALGGWCYRIASIVASPGYLKGVFFDSTFERFLHKRDTSYGAGIPF